MTIRMLDIGPTKYLLLGWRRYIGAQQIDGRRPGPHKLAGHDGKLYPGPGEPHGIHQDRLQKRSLTLVESAQADRQHATRNAKRERQLSPQSQRQERVVSGADRSFLMELLGQRQLELSCKNV